MEKVSSNESVFSCNEQKIDELNEFFEDMKPCKKPEEAPLKIEYTYKVLVVHVYSQLRFWVRRLDDSREYEEIQSKLNSIDREIIAKNVRIGKGKFNYPKLILKRKLNFLKEIWLGTTVVQQRQPTGL